MANWKLGSSFFNCQLLLQTTTIMHVAATAAQIFGMEATNDSPFGKV